jgi:cytidylate kinase
LDIKRVYNVSAAGWLEDARRNRVARIQPQQAVAMSIRIIVIEREYGAGAPTIAGALATRLGWKLWDRELTAEIARIAQVDPEAATRCDERCDTLLHRLAKTFWRGSYERAMPLVESGVFDTDTLVELSEQVVTRLAEAGNCIIVGRGAPYFLRERADVFSVMLYADHEEKLRRLMSDGMPRDQAEEGIANVDRDRAAFVRQYFGLTWPDRTLYRMWVNTGIGDAAVVDVILHAITLPQKRAEVISMPAKSK